MSKGLFVGLTTLDLLYLCEQLPHNNQKLVATDYLIAAGGPATNAAIAFRHLQNSAVLLTVVGTHPMTHLIHTDLHDYGVEVRDLDPTKADAPPISSILVTEKTGERAIVSINASKSQASPDTIPDGILDGVAIALIDGHQMAVGRELAAAAKANEIPVAIDGGSWKPNFETVLPFVDYAICSANFFPPGCETHEDVFVYLAGFEIPYIAITRGEAAIEYRTQTSTGEIVVPPVQAVDTMGAGDIFHGAFCHFILQQDFVAALRSASQIASCSCQYFGSRQWMKTNS